MGGMSQTPMPIMAEAIALSHPVTLATFARYTDAQRAVDYLSDQEFPVENCMIVGTDLRQLERVTGRLTQQKVALGGLASGMWMGLFVGLIFSIFDGQGMRTIITTVLFGALFGLVWALLGYAFTRGKRDFTSVSQVVATKYEVLVEHQVQAQAREMLRGAGLLGAQGAMPRQDVPPAPPTVDSRIVVIAAAVGPETILCGLLADKVHEVRHVAESTMDVPPVVGMRWPRETIRRLVRNEGQIVILPDIDAILGAIIGRAAATPTPQSQH